MQKTIKVTQKQADLISFCVVTQIQNFGLPKTFVGAANQLLETLDKLEFKSK